MGTTATTTGTQGSVNALRRIQPNQVPGAAGTAKITIMPAPANDGATKDVREVTYPRFSSHGFPSLEEVKQAPNISNCPVASILAAHAFTAVGRTFINGLLPAPTAVSVVTDVSGLPPNTLDNPPPGNKVTSSRFFTVKLPGVPIEVSDVLYTDTATNWSLIYMSDPSEQSIWAAIIEKALAVQIGSYENFDALPLTANDWWKKITGVLPGIFTVDASTPLTKITNAANASTTVPTIGASKEGLPIGNVVTGFHGYSMLGMQGSKVHLYDPAKAIKILISPAKFRSDFQAVLFRV